MSFFRPPGQLPVSIGDSQHQPLRVWIDHLLRCDASVCGAIMPKFWIIQNRLHGTALRTPGNQMGQKIDPTSGIGLVNIAHVSHFLALQAFGNISVPGPDRMDNLLKVHS